MKVSLAALFVGALVSGTGKPPPQDNIQNIAIRGNPVPGPFQPNPSSNNKGAGGGGGVLGLSFGEDAVGKQKGLRGFVQDKDVHTNLSNEIGRYHELETATTQADKLGNVPASKIKRSIRLDLDGASSKVS